jgi:hypothetical protein
LVPNLPSGTILTFPLELVELIGIKLNLFQLYRFLFSHKRFTSVWSRKIFWKAYCHHLQIPVPPMDEIQNSTKIVSVYRKTIYNYLSEEYSTILKRKQHRKLDKKRISLMEEIRALEIQETLIRREKEKLNGIISLLETRKDRHFSLLLKRSQNLSELAILEEEKELWSEAGRTSSPKKKTYIYKKVFLNGSCTWLTTFNKMIEALAKGTPIKKRPTYTVANGIEYKGETSGNIHEENFSCKEFMDSISLKELYRNFTVANLRYYLTKKKVIFSGPLLPGTCLAFFCQQPYDNGDGVYDYRSGTFINPTKKGVDSTYSYSLVYFLYIGYKEINDKLVPELSGLDIYSDYRRIYSEALPVDETLPRKLKGEKPLGLPPGLRNWARQNNYTFSQILSLYDIHYENTEYFQPIDLNADFVEKQNMENFSQLPFF